MVVLSLSFLVASALAAPVAELITPTTAVLPLTHVRNVVKVKNIVAKGQARIQRFNGLGIELESILGKRQNGVITNEDVTYVAPVVVGGKPYNLIVDTGSSNTWCGAQSVCEKSDTGTSTGRSVSISYGSGSVSGVEYLDTVSFAGLTVQSQSITSASRSSGFTGVDGIVGLGPVELTANTISGVKTVPTFLNNLKAQGSISTEVLGVYFQPESGANTNDANGQLTLGGIDNTKYTGQLTYFPRLTSGPAAPYWGLHVDNLAYGSAVLGSGSGIVDTGTTLIYIPTPAYNSFLAASGGVDDSDSGLAAYDTAPTADFHITLGSTLYTLTPAQYLVPAAQYGFYGLQQGRYYSWINNGGNSGVNTILGQKFLENYYSVYDTTNSRIGFATRA